MSDRDASRYPPISDFAIIGDCHGTALVGRGGDIEWACPVRFDGGSIFSKILDSERGGVFALGPRELERVSRRYLPDTNVLETTLRTRRGEARVLDCFAMRKGGRQNPLRQILRVIEGVSGSVELEVSIKPRFDYGALHPELGAHAHRGLYTAIGGAQAIVLHSDVELEIDHEEVAFLARLSVAAGQRCRFSITACPPHDLEVGPMTARLVDERLDATIGWWRTWVAHGDYDEVHRAALVRSALVLKLLTCAPTGAIVAAPTTSLPEAIGGSRNWDYRYSWVRDSTMTLAALVAVGYDEVADGFRRFVMRSSAGRAEELQIMYGCYGERRLPESELRHLEGYRGSRPVRIGNAASRQVQLDIYGELLDVAHLWRHKGNPPTASEWRFLRSLVDAAAKHWKEPDHGLWEFRGQPRHFVYSKVMCWVALDRGLRAVAAHGFQADVARWRATRGEIRASIEADGVDRERGCFVQAFGSNQVDASLLRLPIVGFVAADDARMDATMRAIREDLSIGGLIRRYRTDGMEDGVGGSEGAFLLTSFWFVEVLTMRGEVDEARAMFRRLVGLGNDLGLFAEEYDVARGEMLGNFPQAFTHIALINAAERLRRAGAGEPADQALAEQLADARSAPPASG